MAIVFGISIICIYIGFFCLALPGIILAEGFGGRMLRRFSLGLVGYILYLVFSGLDDHKQSKTCRIFGLVLFLGGGIGFLGCGAVIASEVKSELGKLEAATYEEGNYDDEYYMDDEEGDDFEVARGEMTPKDQELIQQQGEAYTRRVVELLNSQVPQCYTKPTDMMEVVVVDRNTLVNVSHNFSWDLSDGITPEERVQEILATTGEEMNELYTEMKQDGTFAQYYQQQKQRFPELAQAVGAPTADRQPQGQPAQGTPTLEDADKYLTVASQFWQQGKKDESMQQAKLAWQIRNHYLGSDHPKTKEVENMIRAAQGGQ